MGEWICHVRPAHSHGENPEENFNNPMDRMTHSVPTSHPLSPATTVIDHGLLNKVAILTGMEVRHRFGIMNVHLPKPTWLQSLLSTWLASSRHEQ